jgi:hypothetical protein
VIYLLVECLPSCLSVTVSSAAIAYGWHTRAESMRRERELDNRIAILFDRMNEREGRVETIPLSRECQIQLDDAVSCETRAPLPVAKVVRR